jgi:transposase InsO family protein
MIVASFIAAQRTDHGVPHALACRALEVPASTFYKWRNRPPTPTQQRRDELDAKVKYFFDASDGTYGSPRVLADLRDAGEKVSKKTVEASMARQGLQGRPPAKTRKGLTRPDKRAKVIPDLVKRDFTAGGPNQKWVGDFKQIDTDEGPVFLATVEDLFSRRMLGFALSDDYPDAELAKAAINMAVAVRGGVVAGVIFHTDKGTQYCADAFETACCDLKIRQSMGRVGCALDNAVAESFFSTLEHERLSRRHYNTRALARQDVAGWIDSWYNRRRRHSTIDMISPIDYEHANAA